MRSSNMASRHERRASQEISEMEILARAIIRIAGSFAVFVAGFILICMGLGI